MTTFLFLTLIHIAFCSWKVDGTKWQFKTISPLSKESILKFKSRISFDVRFHLPHTYIYSQSVFNSSEMRETWSITDIVPSRNTISPRTQISSTCRSHTDFYVSICSILQFSRQCLDGWNMSVNRHINRTPIYNKKGEG